MITERNACTGKIRYFDKSGARKARRHMMARGKVKGKLSAYICEFCGFYHLGHMPKAVRTGELDKGEWRRVG